MPMPRKPDALHELHGTKPSTERAADVSQVPPGRAKFPKDIDRSLRPIFKRLCKRLEEHKTLTADAEELVRLYCFQYDRHTRNAAKLREEGELVTYFRLDSNGQSVPQVKTNLRLKICVEAERQMADILTRLGLSPTAKDRAKPTGAATREVVPGSMLDLHPEWFDADGKFIRQAERGTNVS